MDEKNYDGEGSGFGGLHMNRGVLPGDLTVDDYKPDADPKSETLESDVDSFVSKLKEEAAKQDLEREKAAAVGPADEQPGYDPEIFDTKAAEERDIGTPADPMADEDGNMQTNTVLSVDEDWEIKDRRMRAMNVVAQVRQGMSTPSQTLIHEAKAIAYWLEHGISPYEGGAGQDKPAKDSYSRASPRDRGW